MPARASTKTSRQIMDKDNQKIQLISSRCSSVRAYTNAHSSSAELVDAATKRQAKAIGRRVREYRTERGFNLTKLAKEAKLSKSYLSEIEKGEAPRPSGKTLYSLAKALGVTMSDLLGRALLTDSNETVPASLLEFAEDMRLPAADVRMLATINFRGEKPRTKERWAHIYSAIRQSDWMDCQGKPR
jgi:transcriptional regulator with XRE-family HTH domain